MSKWEFIVLSELCNLEKGKTGLLKAKYAIFQRLRSELLVPEYLLTKESKQAISKCK